MVRRLCLIALPLALCLGAPSLAWSQVQSGSLFVRAADETGAAVPGATVTVTSTVLPAPITGITDSTGAYRTPSLGLGTYTVRVSLQGFQPLAREGVVILQGQTITLDLVMRVGAMTEEVVVTGEAPVIDTRSASVTTNLDAALLETTPGGKDIWNILEYKIPGIVFATPDVGGNQAGLQRAFTSRGTPNSQNVQLINGVNVGDPAAIGFSMNYYEPSTFENVQVATGAQDISMGTSGTLINMVTRSGTNRFGGQTLATYQGKGTQWDNVDTPLKEAGFRPEAQAVGYISNVNFQAGGPLIRNRLFYFGSSNDQRTHVNVPGYPAISPANIPQLLTGNEQDTTDITSMSGKLNYVANSSNRLEGYANRQWYDKPNRGASSSVTLDSNTKEDDTFVIAQASLNSVVTNRLFADTKLSYSNTHFPLLQKTGLQSLLDNSTSVRLRNSASSATMFRRRVQITSNWNYFLPEFVGGRHEFRFGIDNGYTPEDVTTTRVGDVNLTYRSQQGTATQPAGPVNVTIFNSPLTVKRAVNNTAIYGQDTYSTGRLTVVAGLRWERVEGMIPPQTHPSSAYFPTGLVISGLNVALNTGGRLTQYVVPDSFQRVDGAPLWKNWAPRLSGTFDLFGTGRTALKISAGKYLDQIGTGTPGPNPNGTVSQTYLWNDLDGNLSFDRGNAVWDGTKYVGGEFGALSSTSIPNPNPFNDDLLRTYRREFTVGLDHELLPGFRVSSTYIRRREFNAQGTVDGALDTWDQMFSQVQVADAGRDGRFNTADDQTLTVYRLNPGFTLSPRTVNDERLGTSYDGVEIVGTRRYSQGWTLLAGYTYSKERVDLTSLANPNNAYVNATGPSGGRRHNLKATGSYMLPYSILFGANFRMASGSPITRTVSIAGLVGTGQTTVNAEPRGSVSLPALTTLDLRGGRSFDLGRQRLELTMDVYNVTNANTVFSVRQGTGETDVRFANDPSQPVTKIATFLSPTGILGPRIIRFNVTFWFGAGASRRP